MWELCLQKRKNKRESKGMVELGFLAS
jgi:hypothetical protein